MFSGFLDIFGLLRFIFQIFEVDEPGIDYSVADASVD